jgi:prepilin-type processing-associated H-X9-DG protein
LESGREDSSGEPTVRAAAVRPCQAKAELRFFKRSRCSEPYLARRRLRIFLSLAGRVRRQEYDGEGRQMTKSQMAVEGAANSPFGFLEHVFDLRPAELATHDECRRRRECVEYTASQAPNPLRVEWATSSTVKKVWKMVTNSTCVSLQNVHRTKGRRAFTFVELAVVMAVIVLLIALVMPAILSARAAYQTAACQNNLRQIGQALQNYESAFRVLPFGVGADADSPRAPTYYSVESRRYSVHSQLLPFITGDSTYDAINFCVAPFYPYGDRRVQYAHFLSHSWPNETIAQLRLAQFICPADRDRLTVFPWGKNNYRACMGNTTSARGGNGFFSQNSAHQLAKGTRGASKTAVFSERIRGDGSNAVELVSDLFFSPDSPDLVQYCSSLTSGAAATLIQDFDSGLTWLEGNANWTRYNHCLPPMSASCKVDITWSGVVLSASSRHPAGVNVLTGDGSVAPISANIDAMLWRSMATRDLAANMTP